MIVKEAAHRSPSLGAATDNAPPPYGMRPAPQRRTAPGSGLRAPGSGLRAPGSG
ncbi:hypothetical protein SSCG_04486 [Streptomyces clavuligerus]|nr:hypothetical protein SSCG_04486 [Streptomyces clavuligerus]